MPTPVGHSLTGAILYYWNNHRLKVSDLIVLIVIANLPDIDFVPGLLSGNAGKYHHGITHSLGFAVIVGLLCGGCYFLIRKRDFIYYSMMTAAAYSSHLILDYFGADSSFPYGEQLFWPLSKVYLMSPVSIFLDVYKSSDSRSFFPSLFNWHNFITILVECAVLIPVLVIIKNKTRRKDADGN